MTARRWGELAFIAAVAIMAAPRGPAFVSDSLTSVIHVDTTRSGPLTPAQFDELIRNDPIAALSVGLARYRSEVRGFSTTLHKCERIGSTLHPPEVIRMSVREDPFAVSMIWEKGSRNQAEGTLYVAGENGGNMTVWRPNALLAKTLVLGPTDRLARSASRYCLAEASLYHSQLRTYKRWKEVKEVGVLAVEYCGKRAVPELGGRICHELLRTCEPPESDSFGIDEPIRKSPSEAFRTVRIFLDAETGFQIGVELYRADGERVGYYYFVDVVLNPTFPPGRFTTAGFVR